MQPWLLVCIHSRATAKSSQGSSSCVILSVLPYTCVKYRLLTCLQVASAAKPAAAKAADAKPTAAKPVAAKPASVKKEVTEVKAKPQAAQVSPAPYTSPANMFMF